MSCITAQDPQLTRFAKALAQRVGAQRFHVWFNNSTKLDLRQDNLEILVPNDFISEWISKNFTRPIQEAAHEVLGCALVVRFSVVPQMFEVGAGAMAVGKHESFTVPVNGEHDQSRDGGQTGEATMAARRIPEKIVLPLPPAVAACAQPGAIVPAAVRPSLFRSSPEESFRAMSAATPRPRMRHDIESFIVGPSNQLAYNAALYVAEFPGAQYNPLFIHGGCGLGKTHLLQALCRQFQKHHPAKRWTYITGEEFTNEFLTAMRHNKLDGFRRKVRDLDLLAIDDVHFLAGKKATQEEFLHTFNSIEASGRQIVMASDAHPRMIEEFGESLVNRFVSGMVVRVDPPNSMTRCQILRGLSLRAGLMLSDEVTGWIARRVTQNVRELEGAITRVSAHVRLSGRAPDLSLVQEALGDLDRVHVAPVKPESIVQAVCAYFGVEAKDLMSGRRQRTISLARSVAMFVIRKTAKLSFPEIGERMGNRNHSTVISACRRIERAVERNDPLLWTSSVGERQEEAAELLQRLEEHSRAVN